MNIGFERITPTPHFPPGVTAASLSGLTWNSNAVAVTNFKGSIKSQLRMTQLGRCCFCRRMLYDDYAAHLEHFVEKDHHLQFTFEIQNLGLSCGTCNIQKNATNKSFRTSFKKRAERQGKTSTIRCRTLSQDLPAGSPLPLESKSYRWVHPHWDDYSKNINIEKGWIFVSKTIKGTRTIRGVKLNALALIEQRAMSERLSGRGGRLSMLVGAIAELQHHRASEVAATVVKVLHRRRNALP